MVTLVDAFPTGIGKSGLGPTGVDGNPGFLNLWLINRRLFFGGNTPLGRDVSGVNIKWDGV